MRQLVALVALVAASTALPAAALVGCSSDASPNAADRVFLQDMIAHHTRAIAVAKLGEARAVDPRVHAFAERIVREQTPELRSMQAQARGLPIDLTAGATMARHRITDAQVTALGALHGAAFDRRFLALHITSEQGAAAMARTELSDGAHPATKDIAKGIAGAPDSEIPELQALAAKIA